MAEPEVLEGEVVEADAPQQEGQAPKEEVPEVPGELVRQPSAGEIIRPLDLEQTRQAMTAYQEGLRSLLTQEDYQGAGGGRQFVKKSGWRKIATWFGLSVELVRDEVERDPETGEVKRATVWARAIAPNGRHSDGDGHCDDSESRFGDAKGRQKLENDLRATAATRAMNRAISNLVGMGAVSAEEMDGGASVEQDNLASGQQTQRVSTALMYLFNDNGELARETFAKIKEAHPKKVLTAPTAEAILAVIRDFRDHSESEEAAVNGRTSDSTQPDGELPRADEPADAAAAGREAGAQGEA